MSNPGGGEMSNKPKRIYYLILKFIGLAVFLIPLFLKGQGAVTHLNKLTLIIFIIIGTVLLITGDILERKYTKQTKNASIN